MTKRSRQYFRQEKEFREWMRDSVQLANIPFLRKQRVSPGTSKMPDLGRLPGFIRLMPEPAYGITPFTPNLPAVPILGIPQLIDKMRYIPNRLFRSEGNIQIYNLSNPLWDDRDRHPVTRERLDYE